MANQGERSYYERYLLKEDGNLGIKEQDFPFYSLMNKIDP